MALPPHPYAHTLCAALAPPRETPADRADRLDRVPELFLDALFIAFQSEKGRKGFAYDLRWCAGLCRATWREEALWNGLVHVRRGWHYRTHLMYAAERGDAERVRCLLARGAPTELADFDGRTACYEPSIRGHVEVVRALIAAGANVNHAVNGDTSLHFASYEGHVEIVRALLAAGASVDLPATHLPELWYAAHHGEIDIIRMLLAAGADANHVFAVYVRSPRQEFARSHPTLTWPAP